MWFEDFEHLKKGKEKINNDFELIINVIVINLENYKKFF